VTNQDANALATNAEVAGGSRIRVVRGGTPAPEELAALAVALSPMYAAGRVQAGSDRPPIPAWRRAALIEAAGGPTILSPGGLGVAVGADRG
jgi:hypothetical protein